MDREKRMYKGIPRGEKWKEDPDVVAEVKRKLDTRESFEQAERDFPDHICTGISQMDDDLSYITNADSGCGLFKPADLSVIYWVVSTCEHRGKSHQFARRVGQSFPVRPVDKQENGISQ